MRKVKIKPDNLGCYIFRLNFMSVHIAIYKNNNSIAETWEARSSVDSISTMNVLRDAVWINISRKVRS